MCTVLLSPGDNPIAVNKYIISYHILKVNFIKTYVIVFTCSEPVTVSIYNKTGNVHRGAFA